VLCSVGDIAFAVTKIVGALAIIPIAFRVLVGPRPLAYVKIERPRNGPRRATINITNTTGVPIVVTGARVIVPWGTKLGIQHYRNDGDDPADPVFVAIPVNYSSRLPLSTEVPDGGKTELSILVSDCPWRSPIILLNIISARSMVRIAPKVARALLIDASAMNT